MIETATQAPRGHVRSGACLVDGCERSPVGFGWCSTHYKRWKKHGDPLRLGPRGEYVYAASLDQKTREDVATAYSKDKSTRRVAALFGLSKDRVQEIARAAGVIRPAGEAHSLIDMTGRRFGSTVCVSRAPSPPSSKTGQAYWNCLCDCGGRHVVAAWDLRGGRTKSCGCRHRPHGHCPATGPSLTWVSWHAISTRCFNEHDAGYQKYGARGVTMCDRWRDSFEAFLSDMGERPSKAHSIDRIDNDGDYEPGNCRWATKVEQTANRRITLYFLVDGQSRTVRDVAEMWGTSMNNARQKLYRGFVIVKGGRATGRKDRRYALAAQPEPPVSA